MPFPGRSQTHRKARAPFRQPDLVSCRNHRRIEERRGFHRIFHREIGADEQPSGLAQCSGSGDKFQHRLVMLEKDLADLPMLLAELVLDSLQQR